MATVWWVLAVIGSATAFSNHIPWTSKRLASSGRGERRCVGGTTLLGTSEALDVPLIPRDVLFGNPSFASPILSPDGTKLAYLAPNRDNVLNVWVRHLDSVSTDSATVTFDALTDRQVTHDTQRGIRTVVWAQDSTHILYLQDAAGDENFHVFVLNATAPDIPITVRDLTPGAHVKASTIVTSPFHPYTIKISTNQRNASLFDVYTCVDLRDATAPLVLDAINPGHVVGWACRTEENDFRVAMAMVRDPVDSSTTMRVRGSSSSSASDNVSNWTDVMTFPYGEEGGFVDFIPGTNEAYVTSSLQRDTKALLRINLDTKETTVLSSRDECDVGRVGLSNDGQKTLQVVTYNYARTERVFFNDTLAHHYAVLAALDDDAQDDVEVSIASRTRDDALWIVAYSRSQGPTHYVLYTPATETAVPLACARPELLPYQSLLQPMHPVRIPTRDGLTLVAYLTRAAASTNLTAPTPLVLLVHGGPWARDVWGYSAQAQWLSNRGYAVLQVNFRGSTGYGKSFLHKGDGQWGVGTMQHDLTDAVHWAIAHGVADATKVCIYGGSYGGYACLAGLTFTPDLYACGVDIVGPSNVKTLLDSIPAYWGPLRQGMLRKIGNVDDDAVLNRQISPLFHVDAIVAPLLIGHGANDPRVKQAEADQIAYSMQAKGIDVEYVLYPDEGHGFARPENRIDFNGRAEWFLQKHLGGRAEPFVPPEGSTAQFPLLDAAAVAKQDFSAVATKS